MAIVGLAAQLRPSAEVHTRGLAASASVPTATNPRPTAATAVTIPSSAAGTCVAATQCTVSTDDQNATCPVGVPSTAWLSTATTIRFGPIATRSVVAATPGTATRRQEIAGPGGGVAVGEPLGEAPGVGEAPGAPVVAVDDDGDGGWSTEAGPVGAVDPVGVTLPQAASRASADSPPARTRRGARRALGRARERRGILPRIEWRPCPR